MTSDEINELTELRSKNRKLKDDLIYAVAKEKELRSLIAYLNKLGPKPEGTEVVKRRYGANGGDE